MKLILIIALICFSGAQTLKAQSNIDSLTNQLIHLGDDTSKVIMLIELSSIYQFNKSDTALALSEEAIQLARKIKYVKGEIRAITRQGEVRHLRGELPQALESELTAIQLSQKYNFPDVEAESLTYLATIYLDLAEYRLALNYLFKAKKIYDNINIQLLSEEAKQIVPYSVANIGLAYEKLNLLDSAMYFYKLTFSYPVNFEDQQNADILAKIGIVELRKHNYTEALSYFRKSIKYTENSDDFLNRSLAYQQIALLFKEQNQIDSAVYYAFLAYKYGQRSSYKTTILDASILLAELLKTKGNLDSAFYFQQIASNTKDSLFGLAKFQKLQLLNLSEQQRVQELKDLQEIAKTRFQLIGLLCSVGFFLLIAFIFWRSDRQQKKANQLLNEKNHHIESQSESLKKAFLELKSTQSQLIQSEKMASLGELTAGIAHEIQNPLNFVNNFSDINKELLAELKEEVDKGNLDEVKLIADDVIENEAKINHHGKRADSIVKGMLQHSQKGKGQKEPTDINAMAEEYLRLAYHGTLAKDVTPNASFVTDLDKNIGYVNLVQQDISRVLLNLYTNAFYAVSEKMKSAPSGYEPQVIVSTRLASGSENTLIRQSANSLIISVTDNGSGIPENIKDKIFQPFFTTKPTGQGTGLGLSLSYDIVKANGGELKVKSKEGEGSEFVIQLPIV